MRAARIVDSRKVVVIDVPDPKPAGTDVVVKMETAPICGSDLHGSYESPGEKEHIPGHEGAGVVVATDKPHHLKVGDRVCLVSAVHPCGRCVMCRSGRSIYCLESRVFYGFGRHGVHAQYALLNEMSLQVIPDSMSFDQASLIMDPVGTSFHAYRRMRTNGSHVVGVFGLGPMGLGAVVVGAFLGARIIVVEPREYRRKLALSLGAADAIDPRAGDAKAQVMDLTGGYGLDHAVECSGTAIALEAALDLVRHFGQVSMIGENSKAEIKPSEQFLRKELTLSGSTCFPIDEFPLIASMYARGLKGAGMITHRFKVDQADEAYRLFHEGNTGKVVFNP